MQHGVSDDFRTVMNSLKAALAIKEMLLYAKMRYDSPRRNL